MDSALAISTPIMAPVQISKKQTVVGNTYFKVVGTGADPGFFLGGGALVSCSTSTPINHIVFFLQNTSCIRKPQVISGGGGAHPLHPPPRSAPGVIRIFYHCQF